MRRVLEVLLVALALGLGFLTLRAWHARREAARAARAMGPASQPAPSRASGAAGRGADELPSIRLDVPPRPRREAAVPPPG